VAYLLRSLFESRRRSWSREVSQKLGGKEISKSAASKLSQKSPDSVGRVSRVKDSYPASPELIRLVPRGRSLYVDDLHARAEQTWAPRAEPAGLTQSDGVTECWSVVGSFEASKKVRSVARVHGEITNGGVTRSCRPWSERAMDRSMVRFCQEISPWGMLKSWSEIRGFLSVYCVCRVQGRSGSDVRRASPKRTSDLVQVQDIGNTSSGGEGR
jgi:hypothetical protein